MSIAITDLIKKSLELYKTYFKTILKYVLLNTIPTFFSFLVSLGIVYSAKLIETNNTGILFLLVPLFFIIFLFVFVLSMWFNFALIKEIHRIYNHTVILGLKESLHETKIIIWRGISTSIISGLYSGWLLFAGIFLLFVKMTVLSNTLKGWLNGIVNSLIVVSILAGTIYLLIYGIKLSFSVFETILENKGVKESISNSKLLTKNRWWSIAVRIIVPAILVYIAIGIIDSILSGSSKLIGGIAVNITNIINMIVSLLAAPIGLIVAVIIYNEAKKQPNQQNLNN